MTHRCTGCKALAGVFGSGERRGERRPLSQLEELEGWDTVSSSSDQSSFPSLDAGTLLSLAPLEWEFVSDNAINSSSSSGIEWRLDELQPFRVPLRRGSTMLTKLSSRPLTSAVRKSSPFFPSVRSFGLVEGAGAASAGRSFETLFRCVSSAARVFFCSRIPTIQSEGSSLSAARKNRRAENRNLSRGRLRLSSRRTADLIVAILKASRSRSWSSWYTRSMSGKPFGIRWPKMSFSPHAFRTRYSWESTRRVASNTRWHIFVHHICHLSSSTRCT